MNISLTIIVVFKSRKFRKNFFDLTVLKYNDAIKKSRDLDYYLAFFERSYVVSYLVLMQSFIARA